MLENFLPESVFRPAISLFYCIEGTELLVRVHTAQGKEGSLGDSFLQKPVALDLQEIMVNQEIFF